MVKMTSLSSNQARRWESDLERRIILGVRRIGESISETREWLKKNKKKTSYPANYGFPDPNNLFKPEDKRL